MSKRSIIKIAGPPEVRKALDGLGVALRTGRLRRRWSQAELAERLSVSRATVQRMENGDPGVSVGAWAMAAWLLGRISAFEETFAPSHDAAGVRLERQQMKRRGAPTTHRHRDLDDDF